MSPNQPQYMPPVPIVPAPKRRGITANQVALAIVVPVVCLLALFAWVLVFSRTPDESALITKCGLTAAGNPTASIEISNPKGRVTFNYVVVVLFTDDAGHVDQASVTAPRVKGGETVTVGATADSTFTAVHCQVKSFDRS